MKIVIEVDASEVAEILKRLLCPTLAAAEERIKEVVERVEALSEKAHYRR